MQPLKHSNYTNFPVFNNTLQWAIDYLVWDAEADYSYVYKDYFKTSYSPKNITV